MGILSSESQSSNEFEKADSLENAKEGENAERQWQSDTSDQQTSSNFSQTVTAAKMILQLREGYQEFTNILLKLIYNLLFMSKL